MSNPVGKHSTNSSHHVSLKPAIRSGRNDEKATSDLKSTHSDPKETPVKSLEDYGSSPQNNNSDPIPPPLLPEFPCWCKAIRSWGGEVMLHFQQEKRVKHV